MRPPIVDITDALIRALPVAGFLVAITLVAELADRAGVFEVTATRLARWGRHRLWLLWLLFAVFAVVCTVVGSLDTTAVLLTPVALALARQLRLPPRPFALTTLWVANTGSLLLPVSNLTNLLALTRFEALGVDHGDYVRLALAPGLASVAATLAVIWWLHRREFVRRYDLEPTDEAHDPVLLAIAGAVCLVAGPAFAAGLTPWAVAAVAAVVLVAVTAWRSPAHLKGLHLPWVMALALVALLALVTWVHHAGLLDWLTRVAGSGTGLVDLFRLAGVSAIAANTINNLPAWLAVEPGAADHPVRLMAALIGTNAGPLVTPWASLATLLWLERCRARGARWRAWRLALGGLVCAVAAMGAAVVALWIVG